jgi:hypothetical protein
MRGVRGVGPGLCPRLDGLFPLIIYCLEKADIIINEISPVCQEIFFAFRICSQSANCSPKLIAEYLAVSDDFFQMFICQCAFERLILYDFSK